MEAEPDHNLSTRHKGFYIIGDGIFACMSRDFGIFMPKRLAGQWCVNSNVHSVLSNTLHDMSYRIVNRIFAIEAWDLLTAILYFVKKSK